MGGFGELLSLLGTSGWGEFGALVVFMVTAFLLGRVIPKSTHERELKLVQDLADERKVAADQWKAVAEATNETVQQIVPTMAIVAKFFQETPKSGDKQAVSAPDVS